LNPFNGFRLEEQLLIGRRPVTLATLPEKRPLQQPQLLSRLRQLLLVRDGHLLLLCDDRRLMGNELLQFANPLLALGEAFGEIRTSVFHTPFNPRFGSGFRDPSENSLAPQNLCAMRFITRVAIAGDAAR
jgi:hypothetical protein